ncbi:NUDIX hydrolase [Paenibacillus sp. y28]|uniref:NUDIX hydrolase n=1 Tax=Paenibacillus sp. y28 TaxID=3129110 RepID=UPI00301AD05D
MSKPIFYGSVNLIFKQEPDQVLLLKRQNTGFEDGMWSLVAGRIDGNEEVKAAAIREALEEAGVRIPPNGLEVAGIMHRRDPRYHTEWMDFFLLVHEWEGELFNAEPHKCEEIRWFSLHELPENMISYMKSALFSHQKPVWFESLGW